MNINGPKIGVNEPCPCGSGKKYKKCCKEKGLKFPHRTLHRKHTVLSKYNTADLLKKLAGLSILPENFGKFLRLENAKMAVLDNVNNSSEKIPHSEFSKWLHREYSYDPLEDPVVNFVTDLVTYHGGDHLVFPGLTSHGAYNIRNLILALFRNKTRSDLPEEFLLNCDHAIRLLLALSNSVAKRLGLKRYQVPPNTEKVLTIPDRLGLLKLSISVVFSDDEMNAILTENYIVPPVIDYFILEEQHVQRHPKSTDAPPIAAKPLIKLGDEFILVSPTNVCNALESFIWGEANRFAVHDILKESLAEVLWRNSIVHLQKLGFQPIGVNSSTELAKLPSFSEIILRFDDDKVGYLNYKGLPPKQEWRYSGNSEKELLDSLAKRTQIDPSRILLIDVVFLTGTDHVFSISRPMNVNRISLTTFEIEILEKSEETDAIGLWQFATAARMHLSNMKFPFYSFINLFALFKDHKDSFYLGDEGLPDFMAMDLDYGSNFVLEAMRKEDIHSVAVPLRGELAQIPVQRRDQYIPLYTSLFDLGMNLRICLDAYSQPIWIHVATEYGQISNGILQFSRELMDTVGFWLWKFLPSLKPYLDDLRSYPIYIWLVLDPIDAFEPPFESAPFSESLAEEIDVTAEGRDIYLSLPATFLPYIKKHDNEGERVLILKLLAGLNQIFLGYGRPEMSDSTIRLMIDNHAPFGRMKRLHVLNAKENQLLIPGHLLPARYVQPHDVSVILDQIVPQLGENCPPIGPIEDSKDKRNLTKNIVLKVLLPMLKELLNRYNSTDLIKRLVGLNEGLLNEKENLRLSTPMQIACFISKEDQTDKLNEKLSKLDPTTIAIRCLLEHLSAEPSFGSEVISTTAIDRLLAIMEQIVQWGAIGDELQHGLFESGMSILASNRVGIDHESYDSVLKPFRASKAAETVSSALESDLQIFEANPSIDRSSIDQLQSLDKGFEDEFGISFTRICNMMYCLVAIGFAEPGHYVMFTRAEIFVKVNETIVETFSKEEFDRIMEYLHLWNRGKVESIPSGFESWDISPWRYNRRLSLLRKPIIQIDNPQDPTNPSYIWGPRQVLISIWTLMEQCQCGRLKVREGGRLESILSNYSQKWDNKLVEEIAAILRPKVTYLKTEVIIGPQGQLKNADLIGDIDILVIDIPNKCLYSLECKNIAPSRNTKEMIEEVGKLFHSSSGELGYIDKHDRRHQWLLNNLQVVSSFSRIDLTGFSIRSMIVTKEDMITPYLKANQLKMPFVTKFWIQENGIAALEEAWQVWEKGKSTHI